MDQFSLWPSASVYFHPILNSKISWQMRKFPFFSLFSCSCQFQFLSSVFFGFLYPLPCLYFVPDSFKYSIYVQYTTVIYNSFSWSLWTDKSPFPLPHVSSHHRFHVSFFSGGRKGGEKERGLDFCHMENFVCVRTEGRDVYDGRLIFGLFFVYRTQASHAK